LKAVSQRQRIAVDALVEQAERDGNTTVARHRRTIIGTQHGKFMKAVAQQVGGVNEWDVYF